MPPEARIKSFDNRGRLKVDFTQSLKLPDNIKDIINAEDSDDQLRQLRGRRSKGKIQAYTVRDDGEDYED